METTCYGCCALVFQWKISENLTLGAAKEQCLLNTPHLTKNCRGSFDVSSQKNPLDGSDARVNWPRRWTNSWHKEKFCPGQNQILTSLLPVHRLTITGHTGWNKKESGHCMPLGGKSSVRLSPRGPGPVKSRLRQMGVVDLTILHVWHFCTEVAQMRKMCNRWSCESIQKPSAGVKWFHIHAEEITRSWIFDGICVYGVIRHVHDVWKAQTNGIPTINKVVQRRCKLQVRLWVKNDVRFSVAAGCEMNSRNSSRLFVWWWQVCPRIPSSLTSPEFFLKWFSENIFEVSAKKVTRTNDQNLNLHWDHSYSSHFSVQRILSDILFDFRTY